MAQIENKTPLTEQQARALAHWWGGQYEQIFRPEMAATVCHGVVLPAPETTPNQDHSAGLTRIYSLEEAREMENRRGFQEACSPDWVG